MSILRNTVLAALACAASACGGGGSTSPPPPPPPAANQPPVFTSATTVSVAENVVGPIYVVAATDPESQPLSYSSIGGSDSARFAFNAATRELSFVVAPDFETPADSNRDNVYEIRLSATDGFAFTALDLRVTVVDAPDSLRVRRIASGLIGPVFVHGIPVNNTAPVAVLVYGERRGMLRVLNAETGAIVPTDFLDLTAEVGAAPYQGLLGMAFSPDFITDRTVYIMMTNISGHTEIRSYRTYNIQFDRVDPLTVRTIMTINTTACGVGRRGGFLAFDTNKLLLIGHGDCGRPDEAQGTVLGFKGALLRIDPKRDDYPADPFRDYGIPPTNPFAASGGSPEIYGNGLRDPYRGSVDSLTGDIYLGDIGESVLEEVNRRPATTTGLINFGWNLREGTQPYNNGANSVNFTAPALEYSHGMGTREGSAVIGGLVVRPSSLTGVRPQPLSLNGLYIFGDRVSKNIWTIPVATLAAGGTSSSNQLSIRTAEFTPDVGSIDQLEAFGTDLYGTVYMVDGDGEIFRVEQAN